MMTNSDLGSDEKTAVETETLDPNPTSTATIAGLGRSLVSGEAVEWEATPGNLDQSSTAALSGNRERYQPMSPMSYPMTMTSDQSASPQDQLLGLKAERLESENAMLGRKGERLRNEIMAMKAELANCPENQLSPATAAQTETLTQHWGSQFAKIIEPNLVAEHIGKETMQEVISMRQLVTSELAAGEELISETHGFLTQGIDEMRACIANWAEGVSAQLQNFDTAQERLTEVVTNLRRGMATCQRGTPPPVEVLNLPQRPSDDTVARVEPTETEKPKLSGREISPDITDGPNAVRRMLKRPSSSISSMDEDRRLEQRMLTSTPLGSPTKKVSTIELFPLVDMSFLGGLQQPPNPNPDVLDAEPNPPILEREDGQGHVTPEDQSMKYGTDPLKSSPQTSLTDDDDEGDLMK